MYDRNNKTKRQRPDNLIYGVHPVLEALKAGKPVEKILLLRDLRNPLIADILRLAAQQQAIVQKVPAEKLDRITRSNHQGIIAFVSMIEYQDLDEILMKTFEKGEQPLIVLLDRVTDVRNMGAIARSAECAGANALVMPSRGSAQINADAVKTSAGALNILPVHRSENLKDTLRYLRDSGVKLVAVTEHGSESYTKIDMKGPVALLLGSEEDGISPEYLRLCDAKVKIPLQGSIQSLNVSIAAGIMLFEVLRQRNA